MEQDSDLSQAELMEKHREEVARMKVEQQEELGGTAAVKLVKKNQIIILAMLRRSVLRIVAPIFAV